MFDANPVLAKSITGASSGPLTMANVVNRTAMLVGLTCIGAGLAWRGAQLGYVAPLMGLNLVGFVLGLVIIFSRNASPWLIVPYALTQGVVMGGLTYLVSLSYPGIGWQSLAITLGCFGAVFAFYRAGILRATPTFVRVMLVAMFSITMVYLVNIIGSLFGHSLPFIHEASTVGIVFNSVVVLVAALTFVLDFDRVEKAVQNGADQEQSWMLAFGLLISLLWLYVEILRLLMKLRSSK